MNSKNRSQPYVVLADVIDSRTLDNRPQFQRTLEHALGAANATFDETILTDLEPIKGVDEFGGVLASIGPVFEVMAGILNRVHPVTIRWGIAQGRIDIGTVGDPISTLDGPAFHDAGEALDSAERANMYVGFQADRPFDGLVESTLNLLLFRRERLTERQVEVIRTYEHEGTQTRTASVLDVPQQSVSKTLQRADYRRISTIREQFQTTVENLYE